MPSSPSHKFHVLGIHQSGVNTTAAILREGQVLAGAPEERFTRKKIDRYFPHNAMNFCLEYAGIALDQVDHVAIGWNPGENISLKYRAGFSDWMQFPGEWLSSVPNHLLPDLGLEIDRTRMDFTSRSGRDFRLHFVDHHLCHAWLSYAVSGFDDCAILVVDAWGEQQTTSMYHGRNGALDRIYSKSFPQSIGCYYAALTEFLGFRTFSDEWKVMGMAAYGDASAYPDLDRLFVLGDNGDYELDLSYFDFYNFDRPRYYGDKLTGILGPARRPDAPLEQRHYDVAASGQAIFEKVIHHLLAFLHEATGSSDLCFSGGTALNCLFNGKIVDTTSFSRCSIGFAPDDSGNAIGAALAVSAENGFPRSGSPITSKIGPDYSNDEIGEALETFKLRYRRVKSTAKTVAALLAEQKVVGWFQGRSEFGPRALGSRSIFASARQESMKDRLNESIKFREPFRPFAPMLPDSRIADFFETSDPDGAPFMEKAFKFRDSIAGKVPAVVHADGTGRLQSVGKEHDPLLHELLKEYEALQGVPVLVNTSLNLNGEPMVLSPEDALRTFVTSGINALMIGNFLLEKGKL